MGYIVRIATEREVEQALDMALSVFEACEAPLFSREATTTFKALFIENPTFIGACKEGKCLLAVALAEDIPVGMMAMESQSMHISLVFVDPKWHKRGIASALFSFLVKECMKLNPKASAVTVNAMPKGIPFYDKKGFVQSGQPFDRGGILYTPMIYHIQGEMK